MPKDTRVNSSSFDRSTVSPYARSLRNKDGNDSRTSLPSAGDEKEWEETFCPICMEHPHNAVLLICSSQEKGCRPFMCDTSHRHSNCLDQFRNSSAAASSTQSEFVCPLCRGRITKWIVIEEARRFMNSKTRSCSLETCDFSGNYAELRKHARLQHPSCRPSVASPTRQSNWNVLEQEIDSEDALAHHYDYDDDDVNSLASPYEISDYWDDDYDYDYDDDDDSSLDFPLRMEGMVSGRISSNIWRFTFDGNEWMVNFSSSRSSDGVQRSSNLRNSSSMSYTLPNLNSQSSIRARSESVYRTTLRLGRSNLEENAGPSSRTRVNHHLSSRTRANHYSSPITRANPHSSSRARARANHYSSSRTRANHYSSPITRANPHSSSRARANHYSSSRTRANHHSPSRTRTTTHHSSSRTRANPHSSSRTRANHHSRSTTRANPHSSSRTRADHH